MNSISNKPRAVHYQSPSDRTMSIGQRVARYNRYLVRQGKNWDGDGYERWALRSMAQFLEQTIARNLCMAGAGEGQVSA